jgi:NADPH:quinone reductase-like Zn-dependent oxidoreductase
MMKAYTLPGEGEAPVLSDLPEPVADGFEVLIRMRASSVNPHDALVISGAAGAYMEYRYPVVLGSDVAGTVVAVGDEVTRFRVGQRVYGLFRELVARRGSFVETIAIEEEFLLETPEHVSTADSGTFGVAALSALRCLDAAGVGAGGLLFVNGAAGGVGSYLLQIARAAGVRTVATARPSQFGFVRSLGASDVIDWTEGDVAASVLAAVGPVDAMVDLVTGEAEAFAALGDAVVRAGGAACTTLNVAGEGDRIRSTNVIAMCDPEALRRIGEMVESRALTAPITQTFGLQDVGLAFEALAAGATGKISVTIP